MARSFYDGAPVQTLLQLACDGHENLDDCPVIQLGSLSKQLAPGAEDWLDRRCARHDPGADHRQAGKRSLLERACSMNGSGRNGGRADRGMPSAHRRPLSGAARDALCAAMAHHIGGWFIWEAPVGGMFVWATAGDPGIDIDGLVNLGMAEGVLVGGSQPFDPLGITAPAILQLQRRGRVRTLASSASRRRFAGTMAESGGER